MRTSLLSIVALAAVTLLGACDDIKTDAQILQEKARAYVAAHPNLDPKTTEAITANSIHKGMTMEQVKVAWGEPVEMERFKGGASQYWYFGCDWPHHCISLEGGMSPEEQYQSRVLFNDGKVMDWQN